MRRFFLAHPKFEPPERLESFRAEAIRLLAEVANGKPFAVVLGREQFDARWKACGSWTAWNKEIAEGVSPSTFAPLFHAVIVSGRRVGAATAEIVRLSIRAGKPVFLLDGGLVSVGEVMRVEPDNWQTGWEVR